jgi:quercetin 2,3-dioxygenase
MGSDFSYRDNFSFYHCTTGLIGFPKHPHKQISTITATMEEPNAAMVDHFDSTGACGRYGNGDVQYMVAGAGGPTNPLGQGRAGIQHSEIFPLIHNEGGNFLNLFQIWVKVPNGRRNVDPTYKMFWKESIPIVKVPVPGEDSVFSEVKVIIGDYPNLPFPAPVAPPEDYLSRPEAQGTMYVIQLPKTGATVKIPPMRTSTANRAIYIYKADDNSACKVKIADTKNPESDGYLRARQGTRILPDTEVSITNEAGGHVGVLVLAAEPLNEPTEQYGPFVGANMQDIQDAFSQYRATEFGGWPWDRDDPTFPKNAPRQSIPKKGGPVEYPPGYQQSSPSKQ